eukprot:748360-Hanusia_phi.AAC.3
MGCDSLTPIQHPEIRLKAWEEVGGRAMRFVNLDVAKEYDLLVGKEEEEEEEEDDDDGRARGRNSAWRMRTRRVVCQGGRRGLRANLLVATGSAAEAGEA